MKKLYKVKDPAPGFSGNFGHLILTGGMVGGGSGPDFFDGKITIKFGALDAKRANAFAAALANITPMANTDHKTAVSIFPSDEKEHA